MHYPEILGIAPAPEEFVYDADYTMLYALGLGCGAQVDELKFVYPQEDATPDGLETLAFRHFFIQPMDSPALAANIEASAAYCLAHPHWRLSLQMHKLAGIP